jgi:hypothetical protein
MYVGALKARKEKEVTATNTGEYIVYFNGCRCVDKYFETKKNGIVNLVFPSHNNYYMDIEVLFNLPSNIT